MAGETDRHEFDRILDDEKRAIRTGDFAELAGLAERKATLLERIQAQGNRDRSWLAELKTRTAANQRLLEAALKGVRAARQRLNAIRGASQRLSTYDSAGRAQSICYPATELERRA